MTTIHRSIFDRLSPHALEAEAQPIMTSFAARALAALRIALGFTFLWAFLDKTFGLEFSTSSNKAWVHGGSPTRGFLSSVDVGPLESFYHSIAGAWWADWLFMMGLLGIGLALIAGVGIRVAAVAGVAMLAMMWFAEFPADRFTSGGDASGSTNPFVDYHFIYAAVLPVLAATYAGDTWGLGRIWASLPIVRAHRWLR